MFSTSSSLLKAPRVAIVGSGPSGFYVAKYLLKSWPEARVDMLERWPTPFGLVRYGVAPDHPEVKVVENDFNVVAGLPNFRFFGNVRVGESVKVQKLRENYDAVVLACGADQEKKLGLPGESLDGVLSARQFVAWYNSEPAARDAAKTLFPPPPKEHLKTIVVGHGNVALDCARIIATNATQLEKTDIARKAIDKLRAYKTKTVDVVGRRGTAQAAFTIKELRELTHIDGVRFEVPREEVLRGDTPASLEEVDRASKRKRALIDEFLVDQLSDNGVRLRFLLSPVEFLPRADDARRLGSVVLERCALVGEKGKQQAEGTGEYLELPADVALLAVGYLAATTDGKIVPHLDHTHGRVDDGLYCAGWIKRGPSGIIGTNIADARDTVQTLLNDLGTSCLGHKHGLDFPTATSWDDWLRIDAVEKNAGAAVGAPRLKFTDVDAMFATLSS